MGWLLCNSKLANSLTTARLVLSCLLRALLHEAPSVDIARYGTIVVLTHCIGILFSAGSAIRI